MSLLITKNWRLQWAKSRLQIQTCLFCDNIKIKKNKSSGKKYKDTVYLPKTDFVLSLKKNKTGIGLQVMHVHDYVLSWQIFLVMILKVALGVCFALKFVERRLTSFHIFNYLMLRCNFSANYTI